MYKKRLFFILLIIVAIFISGISCTAEDFSPQGSGAVTHPRSDYDFITAYQSTVLKLLDMDLWTERDIQDASQYLMIPMYYAFMTNWEEAVDQYDAFFQRFEDRIDTSDFGSLSRLQRMQFLYLASQYLKLSAQNGFPIDSSLASLITDCAHNDLYGQPTWKTEKTVREHLEQILAHKVYPHSFYSLVVDADFYTLAILCDLKSIAQYTQSEINEDMLFASAYAAAMLNDAELNTITGDYWLFQTGVAKDHKDYAYAGNEKAFDGMEPKQRDDIVSDSSHFRRMPLWLISYRDAQDDVQSYQSIQDRITQLGHLFSEKVLQKDNGYWVTTTFIDGTNGVFRYNYHDDGNSIEGYDQAGGTIFLGYWIMLNNDSIFHMYNDLEKTLPLPADESNPYYDNGITVREQNPIMHRHEIWSNGFMEVITHCNCVIGEMLRSGNQ